jgi:hypothetical protein
MFVVTAFFANASEVLIKSNSISKTLGLKGQIFEKMNEYLGSFIPIELREVSKFCD